MAAESVILGIIIGTLAAIVYSLRVLILLERRIARMDLNIESLTNKILREELAIERELDKISAQRMPEKKVVVKKTIAKKSVAKKPVAKAKSTKRR